MKLLIAEKPSVGTSAYMTMLERLEGQSFARRDGYLEGSEWCITWCFGHLVKLADPTAYGWEEWKIESLPMLPEQIKFEVDGDKQKQFDIVKSLMDRSDLVVNGTDAGREGELIFRLVATLAKLPDSKVKRLWVNSFVDSDLDKAWSNLLDSEKYKNLFNSAIARAIGDWIVGMNLSRYYSLTHNARGLTVGRVQTPTLRLVVDQDKKVESWEKSYFYILSANWGGSFECYYQDLEGNVHFEGIDRLGKVKESCLGKEAEIIDAKKEEKSTSPDSLFDLSDLQKEANNKLGMRAARTLEVAQSLYEKKYTSYPRTDSNYLPEAMEDEMMEKLSQLISKRYPGTELKGGKYKHFNSKMVTDHFAIIPVGDLDPEKLTDEEKKLYELVERRTIAAFMKPYRYLSIKYLLKCGDELFATTLRKVVDPGFRSLFQQYTDDEQTVEDPLLEKEFAIGDRAIFESMDVVKKERKAPAYFTEAALLKAMQTAGRNIEDKELRDAMSERGLGTPATQASIIEILKKREYIKESGKKLISTSRGRALIDVVDDRISDPIMTGEWEYKLKNIEKGQMKALDFRKELNDLVTEIVKSTSPTLSNEAMSSLSEGDLFDCPNCKNKTFKKFAAVAKCSSCELKIFKTICGKNLSDKVIDELITKGRTGLVKGFVSKKEGAAKFDARLKIEGVRVVFVMEQNKKK